MATWLTDILWIIGAALLVFLNGFFVAAEFALVKVRSSKLVEAARQEKPFTKTAQWMVRRLDKALSACQLGITVASLGLGWVGEPAVAHLLEPLFRTVGVTSPVLVHTLAFVVAFTAITAAHLVIGEQAPKIYAIRRPDRTVRWCALPLKWFYVISYPFLLVLNASTMRILRRFGITTASEHEAPHSEEEIRALLSQAHVHGELTRSEHSLLDAVFEFDDTTCRRIMVPRMDVAFFDLNKPLASAMETVRRSKHTRFPLCEGSMDEVLGFVHIKDLLHVPHGEEPDLKKICRPPRYVPETMLLSKLLSLFRAGRQHLAFVLDEHGAVSGIVTMEDVLERLVGEVQDEFDDETPVVVPETAGCFVVQGTALLEEVNKALGLELASENVDTMAGLVTERIGRIVTQGDRVDLDGATAEVMEVKNARATRIRVTLSDSNSTEPDSS
jgi:CBS domain containing-hemolysin-like protein